MVERANLRDLPAEAERGQARGPSVARRAEALGVPVRDPRGRRVGELTNAAAPLDENVPRAIIALDEEVQRKYRLDTNVVDVESVYLRKDPDGSVRLIETLPHVLRHEGFLV